MKLNFRKNNVITLCENPQISLIFNKTHAFTFINKPFRLNELEENICKLEAFLRLKFSRRNILRNKLLEDYTLKSIFDYEFENDRTEESIGADED